LTQKDLFWGGVTILQQYTNKKTTLLTGRVPSPTLNELPTAEDVEAMIESMRAGETSLPTDNGDPQPSQGSAPPSVGPLPAAMESSPSQPQGTAANGKICRVSKESKGILLGLINIDQSMISSCSKVQYR